LNVISKAQKTSQLRWLMRLILAIIAVWSVSLFFKVDKAPVPSTVVASTERSSDYTMADFTITTMDELGKLSRILSGAHMAHYPDDDSVEATAQISHFIDEKGEPWLVLSDKAVTHKGSDQVQLTGNVMITRPNNKDIELYTERLHIDLLTKTADTDQPVRMVSPSGVTYGTGLDADFNKSIVKLHAKVRGNYEPETY
jgi:lipopolysaccharide export system protein LptC